MPPKGKAAQKPKAAPNPASSEPAAPSKPQTTTISERSNFRVAESRPFDDTVCKNIHKAPRDHQVSWFCVRFARKSAAHRSKVAQPRSARDYWKVVNDGSLAIRALPVEEYNWGRDRSGREIGTYSETQLRERRDRRAWLTVLEGESRRFRIERPDTYQEVEEEKARRREMAELRQQLYGGAKGGSLSMDPEWDDVIPVQVEEPEGALAAISYPAEYAEAMSYLRAVMMAKEYSPRCLRLTEKIIGLNPAHYTVWLYRAAIITARNMPVLDEIEWLNEIALAHLKNYQIWHHRHLLVDNYFPTIADDEDKIAEFAASEREFLKEILAEDTKNYHVWSYRSYLVGKLGVWGSKEELEAIEELINDDVRNNSAWSHRFFLVFSNPAHSTPGVAATQVDPKVPADVIDREVAYAKEKIDLAPQNQSPWNYLRGVLVKGGRKLAEVEDFVQGFVKGLGEKGGNEDVQSTHALDLLAEIYAEKGEKEKADLCLRRLGDKWDQIRVGYWEWRRKCLQTA